MQSTDKKFNALNNPEKRDIVTNAAKELISLFYYEQDTQMLDAFKSDLAELMYEVDERKKCLNFIQGKGEVFSKIYLLLDFIGGQGVSEEFVEGLEQLAAQARKSLSTGTDDDDEISPAEEARALRNIRQVMQQHLNEYQVESKREAMNAKMREYAATIDALNHDDENDDQSVLVAVKICRGSINSLSALQRIGDLAMEFFDEAIQETVQAGKDAFERALMNGDISDAFNRALEDACEEAKLHCMGREISFDSERIKDKAFTLRNKFDDAVQDIIYASFDGISAEFCGRLDNLSEKLIENFNKE